VTTDQPDWIHPTDEASPRAIVSVGVGSQHYRKMLRSTENHCAVHCQDTWRLFFDVLPAGCEPHEQRPYKFKLAALERPISAGFRYVVWMDSTFQPMASIEPLWEHIKEHGWYCARQGDAKLGEWTGDTALKMFGLTRDEAMNIPLVYSGLVGFDMWNFAAQRMWTMWREMEAWGVFIGAHLNIPHSPFGHHGLKWAGHCSGDPRCKGHRHDESALSFILHQLKLKPVDENFAGLGIGRHVMDYDVVEMREELLRAARDNSEFPDYAEMLEDLCR
jgi:hypothetical protein